MLSYIVDDSEVEDMDLLPDMRGLSIAEQAKQYPPLGWKKVFQDGESELEQISLLLMPRGRFWPQEKYLYHIFRICPLSQVKVVIIGQDPYQDPNDAWGVSFSTPPGRKKRPSLDIIYKELERCYEDFVPPKYGCLLPWVEQGVFLLNTCLTYHPDEPLKASGLNVYMPFIRLVIEAICQANPNAVFVLWGKKAEVIKSCIKGCKIIMGAHPSPIGGDRFTGCGHFLEINEHLAKTKQREIDWRLPENI